MAKNKWFGTDGVRGVANEFPMTADFALKLGQAAAQLVCTNHRKAAIAKDTRMSGDMLEAALIAGFTAMGVDVIRLGIIPTPAVTTFAENLNVDMAVMITASHNPYQDNGIKLINPNGDKFADETTAALESMIEQNNFTPSPSYIGKVIEDFTIAGKYKRTALNMFEDNQALQGMKIVADCANGCFYEILPEVLRQLGAEVVTIGCTPDGTNINRDCGSQHPEALLAAVKENHADLGIAADGDGDRIKFCDNNGNLIKSEQLMAFLADDMQQSGENKNRPFATTKLSNTALERYITQKSGLKYLSTAVGERAVIKALKENGGVLGGEESGHIVLLDYAKSGDAMMTALRVIKGIRNSGKKVSEIFPLFEDDFLYFKNFQVTTAAKVKEIANHEDLQQLVNDLSAQISGHGRVVIHPSGTEPKIRVWVCGDNKEQVETFGQKLWNRLEKLNAGE